MKPNAKRRGEITSATITQSLLLILACSATFALAAYASDPTAWNDPSWWTAQGAVSDQPANNYAVVTQGQLKQFTAAAVRELNTHLAGGAGTNLKSLVQSWAQDYTNNGYSATNIKPSDYTAMNVGQLKYVGNKVWSQLVTGGYTNAVPSWLQQNTTSDNSLAALGQLKKVFNFDLTAPAPAPVTGLAATPNNTDEIDLSWISPASNTATSLVVQQSTDGGTTWSPLATLAPVAVSYQATNLDPTKSYLFRIIASNTGTASTPDDTASSTQPNPPAPPSTPTGLTGTIDADYDMVRKWQASTGTGPITYDIDRLTIATGVWQSNYVTGIAGTTYTDTDPQRTSADGYTDGGYVYQVRAQNAVDTSSASASFPQTRYAVIDLGVNIKPKKITNTGYVFMQLPNVPGGTSVGAEGSFAVFAKGISIPILPGDDQDQATPHDITEDGTVIGEETNEVYDSDEALAYVFTGVQLWTLSGNNLVAGEPDYFTAGGYEGEGVFTGGGIPENAESVLTAASVYDNISADNASEGAFGFDGNGTPRTCYVGELIDAKHDIWTSAPTYTSKYDSSTQGYYDEAKNGTELGHGFQPGENEDGLFAPTGISEGAAAVSSTGKAILVSLDWTGSSPATSSGQIVTPASSAFIFDDNGAQTPLPTSFVPTGLNNDGIVYGANGLSGVWWDPIYGMHTSSPSGLLMSPIGASLNAGTAPLPLQPGQMGKAYQALSDDFIWQMEPTASPVNLSTAIFDGPWQLEDMVPRGWSEFMPTSFNDSGVIVGTSWATDSNGNTVIDPTTLLPIPHGVILWPLPKYFIDSALTQPLDDYPATSTLLRSPKHIFAQGDNIYIRARGPPGLGNSAITVTVTSDSDTTGISVPLAEVSPGIYEDQSPALPLQLGTTTGTVSIGGTASAYTIKVMDKEVLKFNFNLNGIKFTGSDVMVLRGKFAACGIDMFYAASGGDQAPLQSQAIGSAKFFSAGNTDYPDNQSASGNPMATFVLNAGDGSDGQAVWMHVSSHGVPDGDIADANPSGSFTYTGPTATINGTSYVHNSTTFVGGKIISPGSIDTSANWNKDLEWVVLASCDQLNVDGGGFAAWQPILSGSPRSIHGILGAYNELSGNLQDQINEFWNGMQSTSDPEYVIDAYGTAMEEADSTAQPYAILFNQNNTYDQLKTVTRDSAPSSGFLYLNVDTVIGGRAGGPSDPSVTETIDNGDGLVRTTWASVNGVNVPGAKKLSAPADFTKIKHLAFAKKAKKEVNGKQAFVGKTITETLHAQTSISKQQAAEMATNYLAQQFPEFASRLKLKTVSERVAGTLSTNGATATSTDGYLVQFCVLSSGIPVWGNFVNVSVQGNEIEAVHFLCDEDGGAAAQGAIQPLDGPTSLATALPQIKSALNIKSKYEVFKAELVYVNQSTLQGAAPNLADSFVLAWHLVINKAYRGSGSIRDLHEVWIDATTGHLLAHARY